MNNWIIPINIFLMTKTTYYSGFMAKYKLQNRSKDIAWRRWFYFALRVWPDIKIAGGARIKLRWKGNFWNFFKITPRGLIGGWMYQFTLSCPQYMDRCLMYIVLLAWSVSFDIRMVWYTFINYVWPLFLTIYFFLNLFSSESKFLSIFSSHILSIFIKIKWGPNYNHAIVLNLSSCLILVTSKKKNKKINKNKNITFLTLFCSIIHSLIK